jgi:hypothetical protein
MGHRLRCCIQLLALLSTSLLTRHEHAGASKVTLMRLYLRKPLFEKMKFASLIDEFERSENVVPRESKSGLFHLIWGVQGPKQSKCWWICRSEMLGARNDLQCMLTWSD